MGLSHQEKQIFIAVDAELSFGLKIIDPTQGKIEQAPKVFIFARLRRFKGFYQVTQLSIEECVDGGFRLGGDDFGALEQITIDGTGEVDGGHWNPTDRTHD